jgi:hypothetical protein
MSVPLQPRNVLLDDGQFLVVLHEGHRAELSAVFLERRSRWIPETPQGLECVGACIPRPDGLWETRIAIADSAECTDGHRIVASGLGWSDALVRLWQARQEAYARYASP